MSKCKTRITQLTVTPDVLFAEDATILEIDDHAAGEFVTMRQPGSIRNHLVFDRENWPAVREAMDQLFKLIEENENDAEQNR